MRFPMLSIVVATAALVCANSALAADWCVSPDTDCAMANNVATLQNALSVAAASPGPDRVFLGAATYTAPSAAGYDYYKLDGQIELIGKGKGSTIVTSPSPGAEHVLSLYGAAGSAISDLKVVIPPSAVQGIYGLKTSAVVERVRVEEAVPQTNYTIGAVLSDGGVLASSDVSMGTWHQDTGLLTGTGGATIRDSDVAGYQALTSNGNTTIERTRISGGEYGLFAGAGPTTVRSSFIQTSLANARGAEATSKAGATATSLVLDGVTITDVKSGYAAVYATTFWDPGDSVDVSVDNALIRGYGSTLNTDAAGAGNAHISATYSDYAPTTATTGGNGTISEANISNYGDNAGIDSDTLVPLDSSPLVDAGDPNEAQSLDLEGNPLVTDGNHDGVVRRDIGAFELAGPTSYPAPDPVPGPVADPSATAGPPAAAPAAADKVAAHVTHFRFTRPRFRFQVSETARIVISVRRVHGAAIARVTRTAATGKNVIRVSRRVARALRPGRYRAMLVATDTAGNRSAPVPLTFTIRRR